MCKYKNCTKPHVIVAFTNKLECDLSIINNNNFLFLIASSKALMTLVSLEDANFWRALSPVMLHVLVPITRWVFKPWLVQWENLNRIPLSTWKNEHFCDKPKQSWRIRATVRFWFNCFLTLVWRELVKQAEIKSNKWGAPWLWQNNLNFSGS